MIPGEEQQTEAGWSGVTILQEVSGSPYDTLHTPVERSLFAIPSSTDSVLVRDSRPTDDSSTTTHPSSLNSVWIVGAPVVSVVPLYPTSLASSVPRPLQDDHSRPLGVLAEELSVSASHSAPPSNSDSPSGTSNPRTSKSADAATDSSASASASPTLNTPTSSYPASLAPVTSISTVNLLPVPTSLSSAETDAPTSGSKGLPQGAMIGIAVSISLLVLLLAGAGSWILWRRRRRQAAGGKSIYSDSNWEFFGNKASANANSNAPAHSDKWADPESLPQYRFSSREADRLESDDLGDDLSFGGDSAHDGGQGAGTGGTAETHAGDGSQPVVLPPIWRLSMMSSSLHTDEYHAA